MAGEETREMLNRTDHDLLIRVSTLQESTGADLRALHGAVGTLTGTLNALTAAIDQKIASAVAPKIDKTEVEKMKDEADRVHERHDARLRFLERYAWLAIGALWVIQLGLQFVK